ncbi:MAG TPA: hypothetical protein DHW65_08570 [Dehalococcoidia bacterium]|nr:AraC family transcriptional regulator [SAR202 cluster bacterium]HAA94809.1 hypothetical protein [Dehalococcoidia bacterium]HCL26379.1 hypothetical protein [Dehalococcoidia bacterium]|tara:strand:+ start:620 stop:1537 length:918 start_codon:yes stop_codon:yes gene_type:complete
MLLDKLLDYIVVHSEPFATCLVSSGWRPNLPGPPHVMFHFVMQGSGLLRVPDGRTYPLERFSLAVVPHDAKHTLECGRDVQDERTIETPPSGDGIVRLIAGAPASAEFRVACGMVNVTYGDTLGLFRRLDEVIVADLSDYPQVRSAFEGILAEQGGATEGSVALTRALMTQCIVYLLRNLSEQADGRLPWLPGREDPNLSHAVDAIFENPEAAHTVDSLADHAIISRSVFAERFREAFGSTPINFVHNIRIRKAAELLRKNDGPSVQEVSRREGFNSRTHFSRAFKEQFGVSPAAFREGQFVGQT